MRNLTAAICLAVALIASNVATADVYKCLVIDIQKLAENGRLENDQWAKILEGNSGTLIWDEDTRLMRIRSKDGSETSKKLFEVIQSGNDQNATTALHITKGLGSTFTSLFRLHTYQKELPFLLTSWSEIWTGNCRKI